MSLCDFLFFQSFALSLVFFVVFCRVIFCANIIYKQNVCILDVF